MMKTVHSRLVLLSAIGLLAVAFLLGPQAAFASTTQSRMSQRPSSIDSVTTKPVYPRLSLKTCSRQDGFNGNVQWGTFPNPSVINIWGQVWDVCRTTVHVYLSWYDPGYQNYDVGQAAPRKTNGVNFSHSTFANAGYISVTLCAMWFNQWTCGAPYHV
jgi:hypothetical protein